MWYVPNSYPRYSVLAAVVYGVSYGFAQAIIFLGYAATFIFGAWQSIQPINGPYFARFENIYTVFMALIFGSLALGQANSFAPSYSKARQAARRIFALLDRKSRIDTYSDEGAKPVSVSAKDCSMH
jgi:ABC-type multidrug transport system fused ATPase/permease subunit